MGIHSVRDKLIGLAVAVSIAIIGIVSGWWLAFDEFKVNGPVYNRVVLVKDLLADVLPPPEYILESHLVAFQALKAEPSEVTAFQTRLERLRSDYDSRHAFWQKNVPDAALGELLLVKSYQSASQYFDLARGAFFPALIRADRAAAEAAFKDMSRLYDSHRAAIDEIVTRSETLARTIEGESAGQERTTKGLVIAGTLLAALFSVGCLIVVGLSIARRTGALSRTIAEIRQTGTLSLRVGLNGQDEIAQAGRDLDNLLGDIDSVLNATNAVMERVAANDLTARVTVAAIGDSARLKENLNRSLDSVSATLRDILSDIRQVAAAMGQTSNAVGQVSDGAQSQLHSVRDISAGTEQTARAIRDVTSSAQASSHRAQEAAVLVRAGRDSSEAMVQVVNSIADGSQKISEITGLITQIASQTNMLSLNAAIEAARAGEHGKGFAVVATEVGKLAESAAKSAREIAKLIDVASREAQRGVEVATLVGSNMEKIAGGVAETDRMIGAIAGAMEEQQVAVTQINATVVQLAKIGQNNAAASEEIAATMVDLSRVAEQTRMKVERFRLA